ncbi:MAG: PaaI family thioesterase [Bacteroidales bacterium]|jgi:acyl-CoA thioesterase|nr:PaaI family thioesterase [Bacteroidales bacterium]
MDIEKLKDFFKNDLFAADSGIKIVEAGEGYCKTELEITPRHLNAAGVVQGGALFTLADLAFAVASNSRGQLALGVNTNMTFLKSRSKGKVYATATEAAKPGRLGAYDVRITDEQDDTIAVFSGMVYRKDVELNF